MTCFPSQGTSDSTHRHRLRGHGIFVEAPLRGCRAPIFQSRHNFVLREDAPRGGYGAKISPFTCLTRACNHFRMFRSLVYETSRLRDRAEFLEREEDRLSE